MLKRKLGKTGIITTGLVFVTAAYGSVTRMNNTLTASAAITTDSVAVLSHEFDSSGFCKCASSLDPDAIPQVERIGLNKHAVSFVNEYIRKNSPDLKKMRVKSEKFFPVIESVFESHNIPKELKYLAIIESRLNPSVTSKAGAKGLWQFMPVTGRNFGLRIKGGVDERTSVTRSSAAAAKYLIYLHKIFKDWLLVIASYNSGPGPVLNAIKKSGSRNFWKLQQYLPDQTRKHVKKFISTHYYFEGHGSVSTMTREEMETHEKQVALLRVERLTAADSAL